MAKKVIEDLAVLLGVTPEEARAFQITVSDIVADQYLKGMKGLLIFGHPRTYGIPLNAIYNTISELQRKNTCINPENIAIGLSSWVQRKLRDKLKSFGSTAFRKGRTKFPDIHIIPKDHPQVFRGGLVGVGGKHSGKPKGRRK